MYYVDGQYLKEEDAKISVLDLSILRGFGVFDYLRTYQGRLFHLPDHLMRLKYSAEHLGLTLPTSLSEIEKIIHEVQRLNRLEEASLKILLTGGISANQFTPEQKSTLIVLAYPLASFPSEYFSQGIKVITTQLSRSLPFCKTTQYTPAILALKQGMTQNAIEALYLNGSKEILEGTTSNFFGFKQGTLYTCCSDEVLIGITREVVKKLATPHFPIETRALHYTEIPDLDEAFLTSSNKEVMPIAQIDSFKIGNGGVGPKTQFLMEQFRAYTTLSEWPALHIPRYEPKIGASSHRERGEVLADHR